MNKNFLQKNKKTLVLILLIIISGLFIGLGQNHIITKSVSTGVNIVAFPTFTLFDYITDNVFSLFTTINEISDLKRSLAEAQKKIMNYEKRFKQINEYAEQVEREFGKELRMKVFNEDNPNYELMESEIVSWGAKSYFSSIIIDKGYMDGIRTEMPVIVFQNGQKGVVGKVIETTLYHSKVRPFHQSESSIGAVLEKEGYVGIVNGTGNMNELELNYIDKRANITAGDRVLTQGKDSIFPDNILIGYVTEVYPLGSEFFKRALVKPFVELTRQHTVFIIKKLPNKEIENLKDSK